MTKYVRNEHGGIHSVTDEHFENVLLSEKSAGGQYFLQLGWTEITEEEARREHPHLFGKPDPQITYNQAELNAQLERKRGLDELYGAGILEPGTVEASAGE
jgi:hypothetical protein